MGWLIDYEVRPSAVHGFGVFARQHIRRGQRVWQFDETMHASGPAELGMLPRDQLELALKGGYFHPVSDRLVWYFDDMKFINHGDPPDCNVGLLEWTPLDDDHSMALRDIEPGEELLEDYEFFSIFNLDDGHWIRDIYADFCPELYSFMRQLRDRRRRYWAIA
jgi:hypothetical protein